MVFTTTWFISVDREFKLDSNEVPLDVIKSLNDVITPKQRMTHNHYFVIMTSSLTSVIPNAISFNSVFYSASIGTYHVTVTSSFRLLPVST